MSKVLRKESELLNVVVCIMFVWMFICQMMPLPDRAMSRVDGRETSMRDTMQVQDNNSKNAILPNGEGVALKSELVSERGMSEKHYILGDGRRVVEYYAAPVHYYDGEMWNDIDLTIVPSDGMFAYENTKNVFETRFSSTAGAAMQYGNVWIYDEPLCALQSVPRARGNAIVYANFIEGADLRYTLSSKGLKEDIILKDYRGSSAFSFIITTNGEIVCEDGAYALYYEGAKKMTFPKPYMTDAKGAYSDDVTLAFEKSDDGYIATLKADEAWLESAERAYPIEIDPSKTIDMESGGKMTYVFSGSPASNYGSSQYAYAGWTSAGRYRTYMEFDISSMEPGYYIVSSLVLLFENSYSGSVNLDFLVQRITTAWNESTVNYNSGITTTTTDQRYTLAGMSTSNSWLTFDVTEFMRAWYNGTAPNNGIMIRRYTEGTTASYIALRSDDYATISYRPRMEVIYSPINYTSFAPTKDTYVSSTNSSANYGTSTSIRFGREPTGIYRSYLKFDVSSIPATATIHSAYLSLMNIGYSGAGTYGIGAYNVTGNWDESTLMYNNQPTFNLTPTPLIFCSARFGLFVWDMQDMVRSWLSSPSTNNGIVLKLNDETDTNAKWYTACSREYTTANYRPALIISYSNGSNYKFLTPDNDTYVKETAPNTNFNGDIVNQLVFGGNSSTDEHWTFIKFPIANAIPPGAVIASAQLYLFQWKAQTTTSMIAEMREVKSSWDASSLTWTGAQALTMNASADTLLPVSDATPSGAQGFIVFEATQMTKRWYATPSSNYGLVIRCMDGQSPANRIFTNSSEHGIPSRRPVLYISYYILGDMTPPTTTASVISGTLGANGWYISNATVRLSASDNAGGSGVSKIEYGEGSPSTEVAGASIDINVSDGQHVLAYRAYDFAGNAEAIKYVQVNVDRLPPSNIELLNIAYDDSTKWYNQSGTAYYSNAQSSRIATFELDFVDDVSGPFRIVGNNAFGVTPSDNNGDDGWLLGYVIAQGTTALSPQTITVTAYDAAGNSAQATMPVTLVQDITGPAGYSVDAPASPSGVYTVAVTGGTDAGSGVNATFLDEFSTDAGEPTTARTSMTGDTTPGTHYYRAMQVDRLGNKGAIVSTLSTVGMMTPSISSVTEDSGSAYMYYNATSKKLYYSGLGPSSFSINIDVNGTGAPFVSATGSSAFGDTPVDTTAGLSPYVFSVTYTIEEGANFQGTITVTLATSGATTATVSLIVELDSVAPSGYSLSAPAYASSAYNVATIGGSDSGAGLDAIYLDAFSSDSGEPTTARTSMAGDTTEGVHFYRALAIDLVGNKGVVVSNRTIVDSTPPAITIDAVRITSGLGIVSSEGGWTVKYGKQACAFTIEITATDASSGIQSVEGSSAFSDTPSDASGPDYSLDYTIEANADGPSSIVVTATDKVGLCSNASVKLERDTTPPGQITGITAVRKGSGIELTWNAPLDANGIGSYVIYRGESKDTTMKLVQLNASQDANPNKDGIQYTDAKAPQGTVFYKITAIDNLGNEAPSLTAEARKVGAATSGSDSTPIWIFAIIAVVAVIAVVGFMMMRRGKQEEKPKSTYRSYESAPQSTTYGETRMQQMQPMMQSPQMPVQPPMMSMQYSEPQMPPSQGTSFSHSATLPLGARPPPTQGVPSSSGPAQKVEPILFEKSAICSKCKGIMKKGSKGIKCACGNPYHEECANRLGKCPNCSRVISRGQANEVRGTLPEGTMKATLDSKCVTCNGAIKQGLTMYKCPCGQTYHEACALRIINCKACGRRMTL